MEEIEQNNAESRRIVIPGEIISTSPEMAPGRGVIKTGDDISAIYIGLLNIRGNVVNVVPLRGIYTPQLGDTIIGRIIDKTAVKWFVDINAKADAILRPSDVLDRMDKRSQGRGKKRSMREMESAAMSHFSIGDMIKCKVLSTDRVSNPTITTLGEGLGLITDGICIQVDPSKIPRVIGKKGSMIKTLKDSTGCKLFVSKNGRIWLKGRSAEYEKLLIDAINKIVREAHTTGLTDRIQFFINNEKIKRGLK